jgi:hypothetical protein
VRKTPIIGSILAIFLLILLPIASAVNFNYAKEADTKQLSFSISETDLEKIKDRFTLDPTEPTPILITLLILLLKLIRAGMVAFLTIVFIFIRGLGNNTTTN